MSSRWSQEAARLRWAQIGKPLDVTLPAGIAVTAIWPVCVVLLHWSDYRDPAVVVGVLIASITLPLALCTAGRRGIGPWTSVTAIAVSTILAVGLGLELHGSHGAAGYFMNSWAVAAGVVLACARPPEEPIILGLAIVGVTTSFAGSVADAQARHTAPMLIGAALPATAAAIALAAVLRTTLSAARRTRTQTAAIEERAAIAQAVQREREQRFAQWEAEIVPLLEALAQGRRSVQDIELVAECARSARLLRAQLSALPESLFDGLLASARKRLQQGGGDLIIHDLDVGYLLRESDRVALTDRITALADHGTGTVELTVLKSGRCALVMLAVDGPPAPDPQGWGGSFTVDGPRLWWWDAEFDLEDAPALAGHTPGSSPSSTARW